MDNFERFKETQLPRKESFYSSLNDENIIDEQYQHALKVWGKFNCKNLGDYHDLYVRTDVCLLADVFENFLATCLKQYELDPAHYYTSPGLSWDALFKHSGVNLELLTDYDMHLFIEKGLWGGISMVRQRFSKANNPYLKDFDGSKATSYIQYLDANNLYGWTMSQPLPIGEFKWLNKVDSLDIHSIQPDSKKGYIIEVDLEYPRELHDSHNAFPLAPE